MWRVVAVVALKSAQISTFMRAPDPKIWAILVYGQDPGLVSERAQKLAHALSQRSKPPGEILRIDDRDLEDDPQRIEVELMTVAMFGGPKVVRVSASRRVTAAALKELVARPTAAGHLIVEAGQLRADDAMAKLFADTPTAAALPCFQDAARDLDALVDEIVKGAGATIAADARQLLISRLGADRALSRGEVEKLTLYAHGKPVIDIDDVEAVVGDASDLAIDRIVTAAASGDGVLAVAMCDRAIASGDSPQGIILAVQRHMTRLHQVRSALDRGRPVVDAMRALRPPAFSRQADVISAQCRQWSTARLQRAIERCAAAAKAARLEADLETAFAERLLLAIAHLAREG